MSEERRKASNDRSVSGFGRIPDGQRRRGKKGLSNALQEVSPRCERGQAGRRAGRKRNLWKCSRRMRRSCTGGRAAASARAAATTAAHSSRDNRSRMIRLLRSGAHTAVMAAPDMGRLSRTIPSRCARQRNYIDTGHYAEALNALGSVPPESETLAGIFSARWRRAACIIMRRQWNMRGRPPSMEPGNMQYQQLLSQLQGGGSWYSQQGQEYGRRTGGHEQRLHDVHAAEPVLRLLRRRKNDVCSAVLLHLKRFECKTLRKAGKSDGFCLHSAMKSAITKARRKGFAGLALCGLARW